ncbi:Hypothetical predicted protein [Octopus vulgaris]|uniref:Uncharacterized protein n=1 Tax=Octopus vulgaris TaxID=6645 RepID=A0AA36AN87_OCTVU|nr:Hypothetical predicted protein [Octopus vulgaris]
MITVPLKKNIRILRSKHIHNTLKLRQNYIQLSTFYKDFDKAKRTVDLSNRSVEFCRSSHFKTQPSLFFD